MLYDGQYGKMQRGKRISSRFFKARDRFKKRNVRQFHVMDAILPKLFLSPQNIYSLHHFFWWEKKGQIKEIGSIQTNKITV